MLRRMKLVECVACAGKREWPTAIWLENLMERDDLGDIDFRYEDNIKNFLQVYELD